MQDGSTKLSQRQQQILAYVAERGQGSIAAFAADMAVTEQTIRRDVNRLCAQNLLRRVHGGVAAIDGPNLQYSKRRVMNNAAKRQIGVAFAGLVADGASLAVSIGTTPELAVDALRRHSDLTLVTNNLWVAMLGCERPGWRVDLPGGTVRPSDRDILGRHVAQFFARFQVDIGLFGVAGVAADGTLLDFSDDEVEARMAIRKNCRCAVLVLDHSKFGRPAHVRGGHITDADVVICDRTPPDPIVASLVAANRRLIVTGQPGGHDE